MRFSLSLFLPTALMVAGIPAPAVTITGGTVMIIYWPQTNVDVTGSEGFLVTGAQDDSGVVGVLGQCALGCAPGLIVNSSGYGLFGGGTFLLNGTDFSSPEHGGRLDFTAAPFVAQLGTITGPFTASGNICCVDAGSVPLTGSGTFSVNFLEQPAEMPMIRAPVITYTFMTPEPSTWLLLSAAGGAGASAENRGCESCRAGSGKPSRRMSDPEEPQTAGGAHRQGPPRHLLSGMPTPMWVSCTLGKLDAVWLLQYQGQRYRGKR